MIRRPPRSTQSRSSAASDVYKRQVHDEHPRGSARLHALGGVQRRGRVTAHLARGSTLRRRGGGDRPRRRRAPRHLRRLRDARGRRPHALAARTGPPGPATRVRVLRRTSLLAGLERTWSAVGVHRPAEFSANHVPAFLRDTQPLAWLTVYPFVRSYDWYLLPAEERGAMLRDHGVKARDYPGVQANTVA